MNPEWETQLPTSGKPLGVKPKRSTKSWRSLRESNPSFQIENLTS